MAPAACDEELIIAREDCSAAGPDLFNKFGVFAVSDAISQAELAAVQQAAKANLDEVLWFRSQHYASGTMGNGVWKELCCRDGDRFDVHFRMAEEPFAAMGANGSWCAAVRHILGADAKLVYTGQVVACGCDPDSDSDTDDEEGQAWHMDGEHLDDLIQLPCHCLTVFVPLVDLGDHNGATEFSLGSHLHDEGEITGERIIQCTAGSAILFDYRLLHRGTANRTTTDRPILYFTYARGGFEDPVNYRHASQQKSILTGGDALALAALVGNPAAAPAYRAAAAAELRAQALACADIHSGSLMRCAGPLVALLSDEIAGWEARGEAAGALQCLAVDCAAERGVVAAGAVAPLVALCRDATCSGAVRERAARALQNLAGPALEDEAHLAAALEALALLACCNDAHAAEAGACALNALRGRGGGLAPRYVLPAGWERSIEFTHRLLSPTDLQKSSRALSRALCAPSTALGQTPRLALSTARPHSLPCSLPRLVLSTALGQTPRLAL